MLHHSVKREIRAAVAAAVLLAACGGGGGGGGTVTPGGGANKLPIIGGGGGGTTGCTADVFEPNDTEGQAQVLPLNESVPLNFCDDGSDFFLLAVTPGTTYTVQTSQLEGDTDTFLHVFRADNGTELASDDDSGGNFASLLQFTAPSGVSQVRIKVRPFSEAGTGDGTGYVLRASLTGGGGGSLPDLTFGLSNASGFDETRVLEYSIEVINQGGAAPSTRVGFYLSTDDVITTSDLFIGFIDTGPIGAGQTIVLNDFLQLPLDQFGVFHGGYIVDDQGAVAESEENNNTSFVRNPALLGSTPDHHCFDDQQEGDDTRATARGVTPPRVTVNLRHCSDADDWRSFAAVAGSRYDITTTLLDEKADTLIQLFNAADTLLASNDDFNGLASRVSFTTPANQTLFVRFSQFNGNFGTARGYQGQITTNDSRADLVASLVSIPDNPLQARSTIPVTFSVTNQGQTAAAATRLAPAAFARATPGVLADSLPSFFDLGSISVPSIPAGQTVTVSGTITVPNFNGRLFFTAAADEDNVVDEAVESAGGGNQGSSAVREVTGAN